MMDPKISRPHFPPGYLENPKAFVPWGYVEKRLIEALHYWLCSVRPEWSPARGAQVGGIRSGQNLF